MHLTYRTGNLQDKDDLQALGILSYGQHQHAMTPENWNKYNSFMSAPDTFTYLMGSSTCFLCETDQKIIGMAFLVPHGHPTDMFEDHWSYIRMVGVHPDFGGHGIARKLTQMCISYAIETNEKFVALHTSEFMHAARHIYESIGFRVVRELKRYDKQYFIYLLDLHSYDHDHLPD